MAKRPTSHKAARKMRKAFRAQLPAYLDLFQWLKDRGYADTNGQARALILAKRVKVDSHVIGITDVVLETPSGKETTRLPEQFVKADLRNKLTVVSA